MFSTGQRRQRGGGRNINQLKKAKMSSTDQTSNVQSTSSDVSSNVNVGSSSQQSDVLKVGQTSSGTTSSISSSKSVDIRQNFTDESEQAINDKIQMQITASYMYESMAYYFKREDVALKGFSLFFRHSSEWAMKEFAEKLMKYLNKRGGRVQLKPIDKPKQDEWGTPLDCLKCVLEFEKKLNASFLELHDVAEKNKDKHMQHFLEDEFLDPQVKWIRKLACYIAQLQRVGTGIGEYIFDKELLFKYYVYPSTKEVVENITHQCGVNVGNLNQINNPLHNTLPIVLPKMFKDLHKSHGKYNKY